MESGVSTSIDQLSHSMRNRFILAKKSKIDAKESSRIENWALRLNPLSYINSQLVTVIIILLTNLIF